MPLFHRLQLVCTVAKCFSLLNKLSALRSDVISSLLVTVCILALPLPVLGANWPAWRGDGSGVSGEASLPVVWGPSKNILWSTEIEGSGVSSPIVWRNRVFTTTAVERLPLDRGPALVLALCASLFGFASLVLGKHRTEELSSNSLLRMAHRLDRVGTTLVLLLYFAGVIFLYMRRDSLASGYGQTVWNYTGGVGILGGMAAVGLFHANSRWRLVGSVALVATAVVFRVGSPRFGMSVGASAKELLVMGAAVGASFWWCLLFFASARTTQGKRPGRRTAAWRAAGTLALILTAVTQFVVFNYLSRQAKWTRVVICLNRDTGAILWNRDCFRAGLPMRHRPATPTPVTDGEYVIAQFSPGLVCLDFEGRVKWRKEIPDFSRHVHFGAASSPIMFERFVIHAFLPDGPRPRSNEDLAQHSRLSALDKNTGDAIWQVQLPGGHDSYNTPLLVDVAGRAVLLIATWERVLAYDPRTGDLLRSWDVPVRQCIPSIVAGGGRAYVMSGRDHGSQGGFAIELALDQEGTQPDVAWQVRRASADISSPVVYEGRLFMVTKSGIATCLEAETGRSLFRKRLRGKHYSSVVAGEGKVYFTSLDGKTTVIAVGQEYEELARNTIGEACSSSHAIVNGRLFIRGEKHLFCIGTP